MASTVLRPRRITQPQHAARLNSRWGKPIVAYNPALGLFNSAYTGIPVLGNGTPYADISSNGRVIQFNSTRLDFPSTSGAFPNGMTILAIGTWTAAGATIDCLVGRADSNTAGNVELTFQNNFLSPTNQVRAAFNQGVGFDSCWINGVKDTSNAAGVGGVSTIIGTRYVVAVTTGGSVLASGNGRLTGLGGLSSNYPICSTQAELFFLWDSKFSEADLRSLSADPYNALFMPRASAPAPTVPLGWIVDVSSPGWGSTSGDQASAIDEAVASDVEYVTSPILQGTTTPSLFSLTTPLVAATYNFNGRGKVASRGRMRFNFLSAGNASVGVSAWQSLTTALATYAFTVTLSATATQLQIEVDNT